MKIIALCCFRDASCYMAEFLSHLHAYVDGFIFLDDRSTVRESDAAHELMTKNPKCKGVIERNDWDTSPFSFETRNRAILLNEALAEDATHMLCLDADERVEKNFLEGMRTDPYPHVSKWVQVRDIWNANNEYRIDGIWSAKQKPILFPAEIIRTYSSVFGLNTNALHRTWAGFHFHASEGMAQCNLYHLGSMTPELRNARVERHEQADPDHKYQADYKYLADETGLKLEAIPEGRGWL